MQAKKIILWSFAAAAGLLTAGTGSGLAQPSPLPVVPSPDIIGKSLSSSYQYQYPQNYMQFSQQQPMQNYNYYAAQAARNDGLEQGDNDSLLDRAARKAEEAATPANGLALIGFLSLLGMLMTKRSTPLESPPKYKGRLPDALQVIARWWPAEDNRSDLTRNTYVDLTKTEFSKRIIQPINDPITVGNARLKKLSPDARKDLVEHIEPVRKALIESRAALQNAGYASIMTGEISVNRLWKDLETAGFVSTEISSGVPLLHARNRSRFEKFSELPQKSTKVSKSDEDDDNGGRPKTSPDPPVIAPALVG